MDKKNVGLALNIMHIAKNVNKSNVISGKGKWTIKEAMDVDKQGKCSLTKTSKSLGFING